MHAKDIRPADIADQRLKILAQLMKPEYTFKIGRTGVLTSPGGALRGLRPPRDLIDRPPPRTPPGPDRWLAAVAVLPPSFDWTDYGRVTEARQQYCQDCWAHAVVSICESSWLEIDPDSKPSFSVQALIDCADEQCSCTGGWWDYALDYVVNQGIPDEKDYRYAGLNGRCIEPGAKRHAAGWDYVVPQNPFSVPTDAQLKLALLQYGPLAVGVRLSNLADGYVGSIFNACESGEVDHAVVLIGWCDDVDPNTPGDQGAWRIKNSWGGTWGENGFGWIAYGCGSIGYGAAWVRMAPDQP